MKRSALLAVAVGLIAGCSGIFAQYGKGEHAAEEKTVAQDEKLEKWRWVNFAILAGALGFGIYKTARPFFLARSRQILKSIADADQSRAEAQARIAAVEARLSNISADIEEFRRAAREEQAAEAERLRRQAALDLSRIQEHAEQEIESAGKTARLELKRHAAQLALELAQRKIAGQMTPQAEDALVRSFVRDLNTPAQPA